MKPILFSTPMVQAILDGRKTMTRRIAKGRNYKVDYVPETYNHLVNGNVGDFYYFTKDKIKNGWCETINFYDAPSLEKLTKAIKEHNDFPFNIGDVLWVRETWCKGVLDGDATQYKEYWCVRQPKDSKRVFYKADCTEETGYCDSDKLVKWKPSIFMRKEHARIFLRVTNVRVERLQDISEEDILKEGAPLITITGNNEDFINSKLKGWWYDLWTSINGKGAWEDNPYVFVYEFERIDKPC